MNKTIFLTSVMAVGLLVSAPKAHADVDVSWVAPETFKDIRTTGSESQSRFEARVFKTFEKHIKKLGKKMPDGTKLVVEFVDVDLAGHPAGIRQMTSAAFPRLEFNYQVIDESGNVVLNGNENIRNNNYLSHRNSKYQKAFLGYEKYIFDAWFYSKVFAAFE
ncbi:DUF3016 domain-containing protein [Thalassotalea fusca]